jgi:ribonuclease Z
MKFTFTSLGVASALPTVDRNPGAHVLNIHERLFLIDCGEGCQLNLRRNNISFLKLQNIFISHIHGDHIFGIFGLLSSMSLIGRTEDMYIYAPSAFAPILDFFIKTFGEQFKFRVVHIELKMKSPELIYDSKSIEISAFPLNHRIECFGFIFREKQPRRNIFKEMIEKYNITLAEIARLKSGEKVIREDGEQLDPEVLTYIPYKPRSFAYCSDTAPFAKLAEYVREVDLLYHEATFMEDMAKMAADTFHSTALQAARVAKDANAGKLVIGHFSSRYTDLVPLLNEARSLFPETRLAVEGTKIEV